MTSGGSLPQGVPSPQKVASLRPRASGLLGFAQKLRVLFWGPPFIPPCGFAVLVIPSKKAGFAPTGAVCRSCITMPVSTGASPTRRERRFAFPGSQVFGTGTLPVGVQGRSALLAPKGAKSRFKKLVHGIYYY